MRHTLLLRSCPLLNPLLQLFLRWVDICPRAIILEPILSKANSPALLVMEMLVRSGIRFIELLDYSPSRWLHLDLMLSCLAT